MAFANVLLGVRATTPATFTRGGKVERCAVRMLHDDLEIAAAREEGAALARAEGGDATDGDELFAQHVRVLTLARAVVDPDSPPQPFFTGADQIWSCLDSAQIRHLYLAWVTWQIACQVPEGAKNKRASELLGAAPGEVHHLVIAARYAKSPSDFYGQPGMMLTRAQVWAWMDLCNEHRERFERK
jgi:hypothetical protein